MANQEIRGTINNMTNRIIAVEGTGNDLSTEILALQVDTTTNNGLSQIVRTDGTGKVVSQILPSYIDDILEFPTFANFPAPGTTGKIYVATNEPLKSWRWSGSSYIDVSGGVSSTFGRVGVVTAAANDYSADQIEFGPAGNIPDVEVDGALKTLDFIKLNNTEKGASNGVAPLDGTGLVPAVHLPTLTAPVDSVYGRVGIVNSQFADYSASQVTSSGPIPAGDVQGSLDHLELNKLSGANATFTGAVDINNQDLNNVANINGTPYAAPMIHMFSPTYVGSGGVVTWTWSHGVPGYRFAAKPEWLVGGSHGVLASSITAFQVTDTTYVQTFSTGIFNYAAKAILSKI